MGHPETVMFLINLLMILPNYVAKPQAVVFSCVLGASVIKTIELTNPSGKVVCYGIKIEGSPDFLLEDGDSLTLEPRSSAKLDIYIYIPQKI
jgi:hypothetical protein